MIRGPTRSTQSRSSAASDVYKRQGHTTEWRDARRHQPHQAARGYASDRISTVSYTHLRAHETRHDIVCRLLLEKKKKKKKSKHMLKKKKKKIRKKKKTPIGR